MINIYFLFFIDIFELDKLGTIVVKTKLNLMFQLISKLLKVNQGR
jgi:hypothetical protein